MDGWTWQITAASQAGASHLRRGESCADAFGAIVRGTTLILAVADGAGSAKYGAVGSAAAADISTGLTAEMLANLKLSKDPRAPSLVVREVFKRTLEALAEATIRARQFIRQEGAAATLDPGEGLVNRTTAVISDGVRRISGHETGENLQLELRDLHTTLLLAMLTEQGLSAGNIGDGWLVVGQKDGRMRVVAPPAHAEYANETFFLDSAGALDDAVYERIAGDDIDAIALMTDGPARFAIDLACGAPGKDLFAKLFAFAGDSSMTREQRDSQLVAFLASDRICRCTDDDKTMLLAARVPAE